ncbi:MAG: segregation and condensation protein A [bacterium]
MSYRVALENFEGPLDLLLFLIKKNEVDIHDIPIAKITKQYLEYLQILEALDLENAGEFILMAASLIRIKAQMLLPKPQLEDEEFEDPRENLVQRLLEYQSYKEVAGELSDLEHRQKGFYQMSNISLSLDIDEIEEEDLFGQEVKLFDLMAAFVEVLKRVPPVTQHTIERIPVTTEEQAEYILSYLEKEGRVLFTELMAEIKERIILIVTFVAILDLVRNRKLSLMQNRPFSEIWIQKVNG